MDEAEKRDESTVRHRRLQPADRRDEIIRKAVAFFAEHGFAGSTRDLAKELGITQPLLYRYFPSKDDLIQDVYQRIYVDRWRPEWDDLLTDRSLPIRTRLQNFYEAYTDAIFTREWIRIYLFAGLKGVEINRRYAPLVENRILSRIIGEYRIEAGLPPRESAAAAEIELAWVLHGGIFYYGVRKHIYGWPVMEDKSRFISNALDVFLEGIARVFGTGVRVRTTSPRIPAHGQDGEASKGALAEENRGEA